MTEELMSRIDEENPLIYIVMANYNGYHLTAEAIESLQKLTYPNYRIVVVDDCSKDDSVARLTRDFPDVLVLSTKKNGGLCKSYNVGIKEALSNGAHYVFLVQNDTKDFSPNYLEKVLEEFERNEKAGMVGSPVYDYSRDIRWKGVAKNKMGIPLEISEGFVIKREVFEKIGLFNERLVVYFEDLDFVIRLRRVGYETSVASSVSFAHVGQGTFSKQKFYPNYIRIRNVILFMRRYCTDKPVGWIAKNFLRNLFVHTNKLKKALKEGDYKSFFLIGIAIISGIIIGFLLPWSKKNEHSL